VLWNACSPWQVCQPPVPTKSGSPSNLSTPSRPRSHAPCCPRPPCCPKVLQTSVARPLSSRSMPASSAAFPSTTRLFPAVQACRLRDSRRGSQSPAGAAREEPPHRWLRHRPPRRLQGQRRVAAAEARPEPAGGVGRARQGRGETLGGFLSASLNPAILISSPLGPARALTPPWLRAPGTR
jgi:hypothetical protein